MDVGLCLQHAGQLVQHVIQSARYHGAAQASTANHGTGRFDDDVQAIDLPHQAADGTRGFGSVERAQIGVGECGVVRTLGVIHDKTLYECTVSGWGEDRVKCGMIRHARNPTDERSENIAAQVRPEACRCIFCWSSHSYDLVRKRPVHRPAAGSENVHADNE